MAQNDRQGSGFVTSYVSEQTDRWLQSKYWTKIDILNIPEIYTGAISGKPVGLFRDIACYKPWSLTIILSHQPFVVWFSIARCSEMQ